MVLQPSDAELVRAAQAGDVASLGVLLERHRASLQVVALRLLGYTPEAQDIVQEAMLIAVQHVGQLRDPDAAGSWLRAIVRNACRMHLRGYRPVTADERVLASLPSLHALPDVLLDRHALRDWIWHALESLSEPLQIVLLLRHFSEVSSYEEIAALCGVPVGTVRSRLHQARVKLSAALLAAADSAHDDAAALRDQRWREVADLFTAAEQGDFDRALSATCSPELNLVGPQGQHAHGLAPLVRVMESDRQAGVRHRPMQVTASRRLTIIEDDLLNPPWNPDHCPPGVVWLLSLRDNQIQHIRLFHPRSAPVATP